MPRSRIGVGCQACRIRHTKCDNKKSICKSCQTAGIECTRSLKLRFRNGLGSSPSMSPFAERQPWMNTAIKLNFHDETPEVIKSYEDTNTQSGPSGSKKRDKQICQELAGEHETGVLIDDGINSQEPSEVPATIDTSPPPLPTVDRTPTELCGRITPPNGRFSSFGNSTRSPIDHDPFNIPDSPATPANRQAMPYSEREAALIKHFIESMASWADITDLKRTFEIDVPRLALYYPVLRYAVFAFSARHINKDAPGESTEALEYYDKCLKLLISTLPGPHEQISEVVFAACGILRQYEEQDLDDNFLHLKGVTRMLNSMSPFDFSGGLGEAAAWLCLRQDIAVALTLHKPLQTNLHNFMLSDIFQRDDDGAWASRMIFLLARVLGCQGTSTSHHSETPHRLSAIGQEVDDWYETKPLTFMPIRHEYIDKRGLPQIWMLAPFHAVGLQYYYIAKILLELSRNRSPSLGYEYLKESRKIENNIRGYLLCALGLAASNSKAENLLFSARHALAAWGGIFRDPGEHEAIERFLDQIQQRTGWNMSKLRATLHDQWYEDS